MGTLTSMESGIGEALFTKTQRQVLGLLFGNPDKSYYAKEIVRHARVGIGAVQRELEKLAGAGLLTTESIGNQKHYQANRQAPIFEELRGLIQKTFGLTDMLIDALSEFAERIVVAFIYGSVAKGTDKASSDVDILIISDKLGYPDAVEIFSEIESRIGRTISPTIYKSEEFLKKLRSDNSFISRVIDQEKIFLIGSENDIPEP